MTKCLTNIALTLAGWRLLSQFCAGRETEREREEEREREKERRSLYNSICISSPVLSTFTSPLKDQHSRQSQQLNQIRKYF